jgi:hypothetical protein
MTAARNAGASTVGKRIPKQHQKAYGGKTHFSRWIGIEDPYKDQLRSIVCPDCGTAFPAY